MYRCFLVVTVLLSVTPIAGQAQQVATFDWNSDYTHDWTYDSSAGVYSYAGVYWSDFLITKPYYTTPDLWYTWRDDTSMQTSTYYGVANSRFDSGDIFSDALFDLDRAYAASDYLAGVALNVWGFRGGTAAYFRSFLISVEGPSLLTFDFRGVDHVHFETAGGCTSPGFYEYGETMGVPDGYWPSLGYCRPSDDASWGNFSIDHVEISPVPEPALILLLGTGLLVLAAVGHYGRRRKPNDLPRDASAAS